MDHGRIDNTHVPYINESMESVRRANPKQLIPAVVALRKWMLSKNMTSNQLATRTGFSPATFRNYLSGQPVAYPSLAQAYAIEYVTNGAVPAWLWLDDPTIRMRVRNSNRVNAKQFERRVQDLVLRFKHLEEPEGMIRHKARILSRLFNVEWGEVKRRCWADAKASAKQLRYDLTGPMWEEMPNEEI